MSAKVVYSSDMDIGNNTSQINTSSIDFDYVEVYVCGRVVSQSSSSSILSILQPSKIVIAKGGIGRISAVSAKNASTVDSVQVNCTAESTTFSASGYVVACTVVYYKYNS